MRRKQFSLYGTKSDYIRAFYLVESVNGGVDMIIICDAKDYSYRIKSFHYKTEDAAIKDWDDLTKEMVAHGYEFKHNYSARCLSMYSRVPKLGKQRFARLCHEE